jgi:hypothetical protein
MASKYDPLRDYLKTQSFQEIELTFAFIEDLLGFGLPASAERPQWWSNVTDPNTSHTQRNAWRDAGFDAFLIAGSRKVKFRKGRR